MTVARKINALVAMLAFGTSLLVSGYVALRDLDTERERIIAHSVALTTMQPQLQRALHYRDTPELSAWLENMLQSPAVRYASLHTDSGTELLQTAVLGGLDSTVPNFYQLRHESDPVDVNIQQRNTGSLPVNPHWVVQLGGLLGERITDVSIPIFSVVNPNDTDADPMLFTLGLADMAAVGSLHVAGYANLGISHPYLWVSIMPGVLRLLSISLLLSLAVTALAWTFTRRVTAPLSRLAGMASDIAEGRVNSPLDLGGDGEVRQVVSMINTIISGLNSHKTSLDVDHRLLNMKVEERNTQLSQRNQELNQAVEEVTRTKEDLRKMAYFDSLTSLPNRRLFTEQLNLLLRLAKRHNHMLALLFLDLDNFKRINDSLGHSAGDLLLREVGIRLSRSVRDSDVVSHYVDSDGSIEVSRLGGDEFTVVLNQIEDLDAVNVIARRLLETLSAPMTIDGHELVVTPSIGIAIGPRDSDNVEGLLKAADTAMYHAKSTGKNNFLFYSENMVASNVERLQLETDLRRAVERDELVLHFQPQVNVSTGNIVGVEALIRWQHPQHGLVPPFKFIPLAEEMGLINDIGEWTLFEACRKVRELRGRGLKLPKVAVNVSALEFSPALVGRVKRALDRTGINPALLELELTEGVMMDNNSSTVESLKQLKTLGVSLSIDDFGTGYSSLSYLSHFPLDELKIDRSFVVDIGTAGHNGGLVTAIIAMAKSLRLRLVAEGVETSEQLKFLTDNGVDIIQGYLFSKPVPAEELVPLLEPAHFLPQIDALAAETPPPPGNREPA